MTLRSVPVVSVAEEHLPSLVENAVAELRVTEDGAGVEHLMRPLLEAVWNACGFAGSPNYDANSRWRQQR